MRLPRSIVVAAAATVALVAAGGVAHAATPPPPGPRTPTTVSAGSARPPTAGAVVGGATHGGAATGGVVATFGYTAPTANLTTVANAVAFRISSITTAVTVPAGLTVTNPVEVSVLFSDNRRVTQVYSPATGVRIVHDFPENNGTKRPESVLVNLTETTPTGAVPFHFTKPITIDPLYDVTLSPLTFRLLSDCDPPFDTKPTIAWKDGYGAQYATTSLGAGDSRQIARFGHTYREVDLARALPQTGLVWTDFGLDHIDLGGFYGPTPPRGEGPLLPGTSHTVDFTRSASNDSFCLAEFTYTQTITLRSYPHL